MAMGFWLTFFVSDLISGQIPDLSFIQTIKIKKPAQKFKLVSLESACPGV